MKSLSSNRNAAVPARVSTPLATFLIASATLAADPPPPDTLTVAQARRFLEVALAGIDREFPNKPSHVLTSPDSVRSPRAFHPVFYGHFDWHSSVHGHWTLVRLIRLYPGIDSDGSVRSLLDSRFTAEALAAEARYFDERENRSFERMYGWAWALRLALELRTWDDPDARRWAKNYQPLEDAITGLAIDYLPKLDWPIRCGFHPESAFPLAQMLDYSRARPHPELERLVLRKARAFYAGDRDYPAAYEPSGNDFFSAGLNEADLMRRVLASAEFAVWLDRFFPGLSEGECGNLLEPVAVSDIADGHLVHLAGLNLSRAWAMNGIAAGLPDPADSRLGILREAAARHTEAGLAYVFSGHYEGEHWLGSFAVYLLTGAGVRP